MPAPYSDNLYSADYDASGDEAVTTNAPYYPQTSSSSSAHIVSTLAGDREDETDNTNALSPTDGYFHSTSHTDPPSNTSSTGASPRNQTSGHANGVAPDDITSSRVPVIPNILVEDPTVPRSKEEEAAHERRLNSSTAPVQSPSASQPQTSSSTHPQPPPTRHSHRRSVDEEDTAAYPQVSTSSASHTYNTRPFAPYRSSYQQPQPEAPPAYSPSPVTTPQAGNPASGYSTFTSGAAQGSSLAANMAVNPETQRLLPREPESMGGNPTTPTESRWHRIKTTCSSSAMRRKLKSVLGVLVIISIFLAIFSGFTIYPGEDHKKSDSHRDNKGNPSYPPEMIWQPPRMCLNKQHRFDPSKITLSGRPEFSISEFMSSDNYGRSGDTPRVTGELHFRPASKDAQGTIEVEIMSNDEDVSVDTTWEHDRDLKIVIPRRVDWKDHSSGRPCIQIRVTVTLPEDAEFDKVNVELTHLDIILHDHFSLTAHDSFSLSTVSGGVDAPLSGSKASSTINAREVRITTISGDVKGEYPLYDLLQIHTSSGDVEVDVDPKPADPKSTQAARLNVSTISGKVVLREPIDRPLAAANGSNDADFPARDYIVTVDTASGDVDAGLAISSKTQITSVSGNLSLRLWPLLDAKRVWSGDYPSLCTDTASGDQRVTLIQPDYPKFMRSLLPVVGGPPEDSIDMPTGQEPSLEDDIDDQGPVVIIHPHDATFIDEDDTLHLSPPSSSSSPSTPSTPELTEPIYSFNVLILSSKHTSISGDVCLRYPSDWVGKLKVVTVSGSQKVRGRGLNTHRSGRYPKETTGEKGQGDSQMYVETMSGDEDILIGKS